MHIIQHYKRFFSFESVVFFIDGPGSIGKTFLYKAFLAAVCSRQLDELATTLFGVVASILWGGQTTNSLFKIPLNPDKKSICNVSKQTSLRKLLWVAGLIIWDEALMLSEHAVEAFDRMLLDINESDLLFSGKVVVSSCIFFKSYRSCVGAQENNI